MMTLVVGGSASGKSTFAESLVLQRGEGPRIYVATLEPLDGECRRRIARHRAMRAGKGFETVECPRNVGQTEVPPKSTVLLECVGTLCANELFGSGGGPECALTAVLGGIEALNRRCGNLVVVSNEVCSGGQRYEGDTLTYLRLLGQVNQALAKRADRVYEVACGLPICHKGGRPPW
ncbi:bifunctional adenosylcobinamide kinase/adenosylcobinamide-phosphate guanylyltransferase [Pseudoflavonifractor sp. 524-17]|uniref:bifunctional adenosylcobinamide kinase/adenosylcobinamide-phosphate guanylyltransferase n=1 Tax=Pseudoflavonifractor sp. 524-17 TaxID=2304577 RepID=UPI00137ABA93|nr:bifunctional adenosylcobinamide kinase/adenosylcobinamide-phosphate guanylyltransferase [Pseudoflavonifractor sp. 524-17]NCE63441.1 bifunctional adenosylcobinamide kinase/adenosylcobinamide-phosphate guanylyltransferase [Pseudoflavonifractor sp. 524-17]